MGINCNASYFDFNSPPKIHPIVRALYEFKGQDETELTFSVGDVIEVLEITEVNSDAWWEGRLVSTGKKGTFPVVFTSGWEAVAASNSPAALGGKNEDVQVKNDVVSAPSASMDNHNVLESKAKSFGNKLQKGIVELYFIIDC